MSTEIYCTLTINRLSYHTTRWLLLDRLRWLISSPRSLYPREWYPLPTEQEAGVAPVYVWTLWKGENTLLLPRFSAQFTQPVTQSHKYPTYLNVLFTALCCARMHARKSTSLSLLPSLWTASRIAVFVPPKKKMISNQICTFTGLLLNFNFVSQLHPTYFRFIRPPVSTIYVEQSKLHHTVFYSGSFLNRCSSLNLLAPELFFFNFTTSCT